MRNHVDEMHTVLCFVDVSLVRALDTGQYKILGGKACAQ